METKPENKNEWKHEDVVTCSRFTVSGQRFGLLAFHTSWDNVTITHIPTGFALIKFNVPTVWVWDMGDIKAPKMKKIKTAMQEIEKLMDWNFGELGVIPNVENKGIMQKVRDIVLKHKLTDEKENE